MIRRPLMCLLVLAGFAAAAVAGDDAPAKIADVRSVDELMRVGAIDVPGHRVRLGFSDGGEAAAGWCVLYALVEQRKDSEPHERDGDGARGEPLGPLFVDVEVVDRRAELLERLKRARDVLRQDEDVLHLYARIVAIRPDGAVVVRVRDARGRVIASRRVEGDRKHAAPWWTLAMADPDDRDAYPVTITRRSAHPVAPTIDGHTPLAMFDRQDRIVLLGLDGQRQLFDGVFAAKADETNLPAIAPTPQAWATVYTHLLQPRDENEPAPRRHVKRADDVKPLLRLSLEDGQLIIRSDIYLRDQPAETLLARWRLNGTTVQRPRERMADEKQQRLRAREYHTNRFAIAFGLPAQLDGARPGDTVSVQVMFSPDGAQPLNGLEMAQQLRELEDITTGPITSDWLHVKLTEELLKTAADTARREQSAGD